MVESGVKFLCRRHLTGLAPIDLAGENELHKLKIGAVVLVEVKQKRNVKMLRLYWALVDTVFENQSRYETKEQLHNALKLCAGVYDIITLPNGQQFRVPGSIAFHKMDDIEFRTFWNRVCDLIAQYFLPGIEGDALKAEIESLVGIAT